MNPIATQFNRSILIILGLICLNCVAVHAQRQRYKRPPAVKPAEQTTRQLADFTKEAEEAGIDFNMPEDFKEVPIAGNDTFSFDHAMALPGQDLEIWLQVRSLKQSWASYDQVKNITGKNLPNPDSTYVEAARAHASAMSDDGRFFTRSLSPTLLEAYNADAGKTYMFTLADTPETKHYRYGLLFALQKDHTGYLLAVCLTNDKGPELFRKISKVRDCMRFR